VGPDRRAPGIAAVTRSSLLLGADGPLLGWRLMAPALSALFLAGAVLVAGSLRLPGPDDRHVVVILVCVALALVTSAAIAAGARHAPPRWVNHAVVPGATVLISLALWASRTVDTGLPLLYLWAAPYAFILLPLRAALVHAGFAGAVFAAAVLSLPSHAEGLVGVWLFVSATLVVRCVLVGLLVASVRRSHALLARAFDDAALGMGLLDVRGRWLEANDALCGILGCPRAELGGSRADALLDAPGGAAGTPVTRPDGTVAWVLVTRRR
jgi:PAS domain-containing protein